MLRCLRGERGLSLVELMVVILLMTCATLVFMAFVGEGKSLAQEKLYGHANTCVQNLRVVEDAKEQWVQENGEPSKDDGEWFFMGRSNPMQEKPVCPDGGKYSPGKYGEYPTCSLGDRGTRSHYDDHELNLGTL